MLDIALIAYCLFNIFTFGLASVIMGGSKNSFISKLIVSVLILTLGFVGVVLYMLLPAGTVSKLQARLNKRKASKNDRIVTKLKSIK